MKTATLTVFNGSTPYNVTGKIVHTYSDGVAIDDANGLRWFAKNERVTLHSGQDVGAGNLW